jgi:hypothetical protein
MWNAVRFVVVVAALGCLAFWQCAYDAQRPEVRRNLDRMAFPVVIRH